MAVTPTNSAGPIYILCRRRFPGTSSPTTDLLVSRALLFQPTFLPRSHYTPTPCPHAPTRTTALSEPPYRSPQEAPRVIRIYRPTLDYPSSFLYKAPPHLSSFSFLPPFQQQRSPRLSCCFNPYLLLLLHSSPFFFTHLISLCTYTSLGTLIPFPLITRYIYQHGFLGKAHRAGGSKCLDAREERQL